MAEYVKFPTTLLIADDDKNNIDILLRYFQNRFENVYPAGNGIEALEIFLRHRPEIILSDFQMPGMNGLHLAQKIKEIEPQTQIVIMSAFDSSDLFVKAIEIGVNFFVQKPFEIKKILQSLENCYKNIEFHRKLTKAENDLKSLNHQLEDKIQERTDSLQKINSQLISEINERKLMEEELTMAKLAAEFANRTKDTFLANMSHELRTPLNGIFGLVNLLQKTELNAKQSNYLQYLQKGAKFLLEIINDILDISSIEAGRFLVVNEPFSIGKLIDYLFFSQSLAASKKNLLIKKKFDQRIPETLVGDEGRIRQVLTNLLGNAIKFSDKGEIELGVELEEQTQDAVTLLFYVKDNGIGISENNRNKLFKRFSQVDDSLTRRFGGTGLGLFISKQLVESMGGRIWVDSVEGKGSTFYFTTRLEIPKELSESGQSRTDMIDSMADQLQIRDHNYRILIFEDNHLSRMVISEFFTDYGYNVVAVGTGREGMEEIEKSKFDLVIMDIQLPDYNGRDMTTMIRNGNSPNKSIPIIALSAHSAAIEEQMALAAGMDGFITKPVELPVLEAKILGYLNISNKHNSELRPAAIKAEVPPPVDFGLLNKVVKGKKEGLDRYINTLLTHYKDDYNSLLNAIDAKNLNAAADFSHKLKATFGNFSAHKVMDELQIIRESALSGNIDVLAQQKVKLQNEVTKVINYLNNYLNS